MKDTPFPLIMWAMMQRTRPREHAPHLRQPPRTRRQTDCQRQTVTECTGGHIDAWHAFVRNVAVQRASVHVELLQSCPGEEAAQGERGIQTGRPVTFAHR